VSRARGLRFFCMRAFGSSVSEGGSRRYCRNAPMDVDRCEGRTLAGRDQVSTSAASQRFEHAQKRSTYSCHRRSARTRRASTSSGDAGPSTRQICVHPCRTKDLVVSLIPTFTTSRLTERSKLVHGFFTWQRPNATLLHLLFLTITRTSIAIGCQYDLLSGSERNLQHLTVNIAQMPSASELYPH
jgi:hypothetical protein